MTERTGLTKMQGQPLTLVGDAVEKGSQAPSFAALKTDLTPVELTESKGKIRIFASVPSLDTPVCDRETKRFNEEARKLGDGVEVYIISMDLPFAQARWLDETGVDKIQTLSDHKDASFGHSYGVLAKELRLLARAVFVVDGENTVRYTQIVPEAAEEPNYDEVLSAVKQLL